MRITVLGLGNMGHAIASAFSAGGHDVCGWNRSPRSGEGISYRISPDLIESCRLAELVFIITSDYTAATALLERVAAEGNVVDRTIISAPSGAPGAAVEFAARVKQSGAVPLDCAIMGYPGDIASSRIYLLYAGDPAHFKAARHALVALGPNQVHVGTNAGAAKAIDAGLLARSYSWLIGYFEALTLARTQGVDPAQFAELSAAIIGPFQANVIRSTEAIVSANHGPAKQASIFVHRSALQAVVTLAKSGGLSVPILDVCLDVLERAVERGFGDSDIAAAYPLASNN